MEREDQGGPPREKQAAIMGYTEITDAASLINLQPPALSPSEIGMIPDHQAV
jgi:hypothetical protein